MTTEIEKQFFETFGIEPSNTCKYAKYGYECTEKTNAILLLGQECNRLKEEVSLLKESNSKLQQIEDVNSLEKCYLQQLDQLKAENEDLENQLKREKERFEKQDKFSAMFIQELKNEKSSLVNEYLKKIGQLQSENEELKEYIKHLHNLCGNETDKQYKYKQTLIEVKGFVENEMIPNGDTYIILQKISEVLE